GKRHLVAVGRKSCILLSVWVGRDGDWHCYLLFRLYAGGTPEPAPRKPSNSGNQSENRGHKPEPLTNPANPSRRSLWSDRNTRTGISLQSLQVRQQVRCTLISKLPVFFECLRNNTVEFRSQRTVTFEQGWRFTVQNRVKNDSGTSTAKRRFAGCHFVHHNP